MGYIRGRLSISLVAMQAGDYENAHKCYERALDLDRQNVDAWVARGAAHANQHKLQQAAHDFETALGAASVLSCLLTAMAVKSCVR